MIRQIPATALALSLLFAGAGAAQTAPAPPPAPSQAIAGPLVTAVEIRSETDISDRLDELQGMLSFAPGEPFTAEAAAHTLRNIQASGIASEVEIYDRPDDSADSTGSDTGGVVVMLVLRPVVEVSEVRLEGELDVRARELPARAAAERGRAAQRREGRTGSLPAAGLLPRPRLPPCRGPRPRHDQRAHPALDRHLPHPERPAVAHRGRTVRRRDRSVPEERADRPSQPQAGRRLCPARRPRRRRPPANLAHSAGLPHCAGRRSGRRDRGDEECRRPHLSRAGGAAGHPPGDRRQ